MATGARLGRKSIGFKEVVAVKRDFRKRMWKHLGLRRVITGGLSACCRHGAAVVQFPVHGCGSQVLALPERLAKLANRHKPDDEQRREPCGHQAWLPKIEVRGVGWGLLCVSGAVAHPMPTNSGENQGRLGCGDEFLEGVGEVTEVHLLSPWGAISAPPTDRAAGAEVDKMATWELTRPLPASGQKAGFCFAVPLALQMSPTGQLALRTRRQHTAQHLDIQNRVLRSHNVLHRSGRTST
ncbi:hypothetical protein PCL_07282 [Purpureocillium lilacinum]|uniref:Uncharacterized protein n=1 Tax=Purpureocillium lilacinum TaxID=33203 RepID=A0A2U3DSL3_PURLI|nr:hypothetical protein PCL_07282 [Purpureocillium lilacinum]